MIAYGFSQFFIKSFGTTCFLSGVDQNDEIEMIADIAANRAGEQLSKPVRHGPFEFFHVERYSFRVATVVEIYCCCG